MPNIVALIQDEKVRRQAEQFFEELGIDDLRVATFKSEQEFTDLYRRDLSIEDKSIEQGDSSSEGADLKLFSDVNLLVFSLDSIKQKPLEWIEKVAADFKKFKHWPQAAPTRIVLLKFEDDNVQKMDLIHPLLDDIIFLPMDRLIFLQKLEIYLGLPQLIKPKFLFKQEVKMEIEISKVATLDRLSEVGLAIRNPIPLRRGLPGHFYLQFPGDKTALEIWGKVLRSEPHPKLPGQYLVYFTFFGIPKPALTRIRQTLSKTQNYSSLISEDAQKFKFKPDDLFLSANDLLVFGGAIIEPDETVGAALAELLSKDMDRLRLTVESSYQLFLHRFLGDSSHSHQVPPKPTEKEDFYSPTLTLTLTLDGFKCLSVQPEPQVGDLWLGHPAVDLFTGPDKWIALVVDKASRLLIEETAQFAAKGRAYEKLLVLQDAQNQRRAVNVKFSQGDAENLVQVTLRPAGLSDLASTAELTAQKELEFLILDTAYVPEDPAAWILGLRTKAIQMKLVKEPNQLKFFLISDVDQPINPIWLNNPDILGLAFKPVDGRQMSFMLSEYLQNKNTIYQFENIGWAQPGVPVHVSKGVQLEAISEYGATLKSKQPLVAGTVIFLRRSIFDNAPNQSLAARVYGCEPHSSDKDYFQVFVNYFGINDQFLKFARTWIRENYALTKSGQGS